MNDHFSDDLTPLQALLLRVYERHPRVWPYVYEAIDLAHLATERQLDLSSKFVPGSPGLVRARNDVQNDCWRFLQAISPPLIDAGAITDCTEIDGGGVLLLPDSLPLRIKKGDEHGSTSNTPTKKIRRMERAANQLALFPGQLDLDLFIAEGYGVDIVFGASEVLYRFDFVALRLATARESPLIYIDPPERAILQAISPSACDIADAARSRIAAS